MKKSSWVVVGIICVLAAAMVYFQISARPRPADEEQIHMLLAKGQSAIERKDLKGVMSCVSKDYRDSTGLTFDALHMHALEAIRAEGHYDVLLEHTSVEVRGKTASAKARATVFLGCDHAGMQRLFSNSVTLHFKKEKSKRFLVIPTRTWKVARINGLPTDLGG